MIGNPTHNVGGRIDAGRDAPARRAIPYSATAPQTRNGHWPALTSGAFGPSVSSHVSQRSPFDGEIHHLLGAERRGNELQPSRLPPADREVEVVDRRIADGLDRKQQPEEQRVERGPGGKQQGGERRGRRPRAQTAATRLSGDNLAGSARSRSEPTAKPQEGAADADGAQRRAVDLPDDAEELERHDDRRHPGHRGRQDAFDPCERCRTRDDHPHPAPERCVQEKGDRQIRHIGRNQKRGRAARPLP